MTDTPMVATQIRRLTPADWAAVRAARLAALAESPHAFASTLEREQSLTEADWRGRLGRAASFGAWIAGPPAALEGQITTFPEPDATDGPAVWHLVGMWISPRLRGSGVAAALVAAVCELARDQGGSHMVLWVTDVNARARAFYARTGFTPTGERALVRPEEPDHWEGRMIRALDQD
jgi:ribosomal protein S18 acetylase RimI-like enzyme